MVHMGGCQNYGPFLGPYYNTAPYISGTQKGTIILTPTHIGNTEVVCNGLCRFRENLGRSDPSFAAWGLGSRVLGFKGLGFKVLGV